MSEHRTRVYLFWNKERATGCREILFSAESLTVSLTWDSGRGHFATSDTLATGVHAGMLLGDDFEALRVEPFRVLPSATCVSVQLRSEVAAAATSNLSPNGTPDTSKGTLDTSKGALDTSNKNTTDYNKNTGDYYDHLIEENHYKIPREILTEDLYQIPSNIPVPHSLPTGPKRPLFIPRSPQRCQATESTPAKTSAPVAPPRKVREGLDLSHRIPSHYDTCSRLSAVLTKQTSESGTRATSPLRGSSPLDPPVSPVSPLASQRHLMLRRPRIATALPGDASGSKECLASLPIPTMRVSTSATSPLAAAKSPPNLPHSPLYATHSTSEVFEETPGDLLVPVIGDTRDLVPVTEGTRNPLVPVTEATPGDHSVPVIEGTGDPLVPVLKEETPVPLVPVTEVSQLREQVTGLLIELGDEVLERERLEEEVSSGRRECEQLRRDYEEVSKECATNLRLLEEERACSDKLRCQIINLKTLRNQEKGPKLLKPKPILPKPIKKL